MTGLPVACTFVTVRVGRASTEFAALRVEADQDVGSGKVLVRALTGHADRVEAALTLFAFAHGTRVVAEDRARLRESIAVDALGLHGEWERIAETTMLALLVHPEFGDLGLAAWARLAELQEARSAADEVRLLARRVVQLREDLARENSLTAVQSLHALLSRGDAATHDLVADVRGSEQPQRFVAQDGLVGQPRGDGEPPFVAVERETIDAVFAADGPFANALVGYVPRPEQVELAHAVAKALHEGKALVAEAGTGVGKSLGYLVPSALFSWRNQVPVILATRTKNLQAQLFEKDVPTLVRALGIPLSVALVKGRGDYLCLRRLATVLEQAMDDGDPHDRLGALYLERFAACSADGDLERVSSWMLRRLPSLSRLVDDVRCEHGPSGRRCRFGTRCFYPRLARRVAGAHLLIANHALALNWPRGFFEPTCIVFDEGHDLPDSATEAFGLEVSEGQARFTLARLLGRKRGAGAAADLRRAEQKSGVPLLGIREQVEQATAAAAALIVRMDGWSSTLAPLFAGAGTPEDGDVRRLVRLDAPVRGSPAFEAFAAAARAWNAEYRSIAVRLAELSDHLEASGLEDRDASGTLAELRFDFGLAAERVDAVAAALDAILEGSDRQVAWIEQRGGALRTSIALRMVPIEIGAEVRMRVLERLHATVMTSATLSSAGDFTFFAGQTGLDEFDAARKLEPLRLGSPFDYARQLRFVLPLALGDPLARDANAAARVIARTTFALAVLLEGRTLVLFNARSRMTRVAELLRAPLAREGIEVLCPGQDGSTARVLERFRNAERAVLLGARSFWEGVDAPGARIKCVIQERIPFESPGDPVHAARCEALDRRGKSGFRDYSLQRALLRIRQGSGRIVRGPTDSGLVVLLDPRIVTQASYGPAVRASLPAPLSAGPAERVLADALASLGVLGAAKIPELLERASEALSTDR
ncbi:MAG: hypothetical protein IPH13_21080 [Planctomycetes bacterium]|nr:hypothetical protein [Planctomycetota bacterium]